MVSNCEMFKFFTQDYWPLRQETYTNLQAAICHRRINTFCRLTLIHIRPLTLIYGSSSANTPQTPRTPASASSSSLGLVDFFPTNTRLVPHIISALQTRIIPEARALDDDTEIDDQVVLQTRVHVVKVLLELLCLNDGGIVSRMVSPRDDVFGSYPNAAVGVGESIAWAANTLASWYRAGAAEPWRDVLENAFQQVVCF